MIGLRTLLLFYRRHLRVQPLRELMAVVGVAAGVALLFAVQVSNSSITGSFEELVHGVAGRATLEVATRSPEGFKESVATEIASTQGIRASAPIFEQPVVMLGPKSSRALALIGADERLASLGGQLFTRLESYAETSRRGLLVLPQPIASAIGVRRGDVVAIEVGARTEHLTLAATVPASQLGASRGKPDCSHLATGRANAGGPPGPCEQSPYRARARHAVASAPSAPATLWRHPERALGQCRIATACRCRQARGAGDGTV